MTSQKQGMTSKQGMAGPGIPHRGLAIFGAMKIAVFLLGTLSCLFLSCSVPEDQLWDNRIADISHLSTKVSSVEAINLDIGNYIDSLNMDSLERIAKRDLGIHTFHSTTPGTLDTGAFIDDSLVPALVMESVKNRLLHFFETSSLNKAISAWETKQSAQFSDSLLQVIIHNAQTQFPEGTYLDSLLRTSLGTVEFGVLKIPVGAFLIQNDGEYWWVVLTKWGYLPKTDNPDSLATDVPRLEHIEGTIFDAKSRQELGRFFCN